MNKEKVNSTSVSVLISPLTKASFFGAGFNYVYNNAGSFSLLSVFIGLIVGFFISLIYLYLFNKGPIYENTIKYIKKPFGYIINIIFILASILYASLSFWRITDFLISQYLTKTPIVIIGILVISIVLYTIIRSKEVLARFGIICIILTSIFLLTNIIGLFNYVDINNLKPFIFDTKGILKGSLGFILMFTGPLFFINTFNKNDLVDKEKFNKKFIIFYLISSFIILLIFFMVLTIFSSEVISIYSYPVYMVLKKINLSSFVDSIENVSTLLWYIYLHILILCSLFYSKLSILSTFKIKDSKKNNIIIGIILCIIIFTFPLLVFHNNYFITKQAYIILPIIVNSTLILLSIFLYIIFKIKRIEN